MGRGPALLSRLRNQGWENRHSSGGKGRQVSGDLGPASVERRGPACLALIHGSPQRAILYLEALTSELCDNPSSTCLVLAGILWSSCHMHAGTRMTEERTAEPQVQLGTVFPPGCDCVRQSRVPGSVRVGRGTVGGSRPYAGAGVGSPRRPPDG
jgi:hypothetical protein